jgi:hypothetical protein
MLLGLALWFVYAANGRDITSYDTWSTTMLVLTILRGEGVYIDRFERVMREPDGKLPHYVVRRGEHILSRYPVAPALLVAPLAAPQVAMLDWLVPGWDKRAGVAINETMWMAKRSMAFLMAVTAVILHRFLIGLGLYRAAVLAVLAAAMGSDLWVVGSQGLWQHGPAAFALTSALALIYPRPAWRGRLVLAGLATTFLVACRLIDVLFAGVIVVWLAQTRTRGLPWFLAIPLVGAIALIGYNVWFFGSILGGQAQLEELHPALHGVSGPWSGTFLEGAAGTLFSPNRGLFVFSPWVAVALAATTLPAVARRVASHRLVCWLLAAVIPYFILVSKYAVWWGGHCFGPRYWTDVIPIFAVLLAFGLDWMRERSRALLTVTTVTIVISIGVQAIGAFCYPSTWNENPANVDRHHERLWDWRDTEILRCLIETRNPQTRRLDPRSGRPLRRPPSSDPPAQTRPPASALSGLVSRS